MVFKSTDFAFSLASGSVCWRVRGNWCFIHISYLTEQGVVFFLKCSNMLLNGKVFFSYEKQWPSCWFFLCLRTLTLHCRNREHWQYLLQIHVMLPPLGWQFLTQLIHSVT